MKKTIVILIGVIVIASVYSFMTAQAETRTSTADPSSNYIIIRWTPYASIGKNIIQVSFGGNKIENIELTKEQIKEIGASNVVIDLLNKYDSEGYTVVATTNSSVATLTEINYLLKKVK